MSKNISLDNLLAEIGKNIKQFRVIKKITQEKAAEGLNITNKHLSELERGLAVPSLDLLTRIANFYEVKLNDVIYMQSDDSKKDLIKRIELLLEKCEIAQLEIIYKVVGVLS